MIDGGAAAIIAGHRARRIGERGIRTVDLDVYDQEVVASRYSIVHAWRATDRRATSLFYLTAPSAMAGTAVLLVEDADSDHLEILLRLRTSRALIPVHSTRGTQCVLGTDFTYEDLRFWLPLANAEHVQLADPGDDPAGCLAVCGRRRAVDGASERFLATFHPDHLAVQRILWQDDTTRAVRRERWAEDHVLIDRVWTSRRIVVQRFAGEYVSHMSLRRVAYGVGPEHARFSPAGLESLTAEEVGVWVAATSAPSAG